MDGVDMQGIGGLDYSALMLASLLPGLRDVRTPLATGYLWLVALWLVLHEHVPKSVEEASGPIKSLFELGALLGATVLLAALSFIAYLIGTMLRPNPSQNDFGLVYLARNFGFPRLLRLRRASNERWKSAPILNFGMSRSAVLQLSTFIETRIREAELPLSNADHANILGIGHDVADQLNWSPLKKYLDQLVSDFPAVGIQLQAKNRDFWDTYDRHSAEAEFRFSIAPPIILMITIWVIQSGNLWWLLMFIVPFSLGYLGLAQYLRANSTLVQAVILKMVEPPTLERLDEYIAQKKVALHREEARKAAEAEQERKPFEEMDRRAAIERANAEERKRSQAQLPRVALRSDDPEGTV
jgi:hypothetical protein